MFEGLFILYKHCPTQIVTPLFQPPNKQPDSVQSKVWREATTLPLRKHGQKKKNVDEAQFELQRPVRWQEVVALQTI